MERPLSLRLPAGAPILLCRPDRVGDAIIASACFTAIRAALPDHPLFYLARPAMRSLFAGHPALAGFVELPADAAILAPWLREVRPAAVIHLQPDPICLEATRSAEVTVRVGYGKRSDPSLTQAFADLRARGLQHESDFNFELLAPLGVPNPGEARPVVHLAPSAQESLREKLALARWTPREPYAVVNPTAHSETLRWPADRFAALATRLQDELGWRIVVTGAKPDDASVVEMLARLPPRVPAENLAGRLDLAELGWLLRDAQAHVSRDTGTSHLAAAVDCPTVTIFGRLAGEYGPIRWRPLGRPERMRVVETSVGPRRFFERTRSFWARGFKAITVDQVFDAVRAMR